MRLTEQERAIQAGEAGPAAREALEYQLRLGRFFGAERLV